MRLIRFLLQPVICLCPLSLLAQGPNVSKSDVEAVLVELDSAIVHKKEYQELRKAQADSLERIVSTCPPAKYVEKCKELYNLLSDIDGRGALKTLERIRRTEQYEHDTNLQAWTELNASHVYGTMGLYHKANNITAVLDPATLSTEERIHYNRTNIDNGANISDYMSDISVVQNEEVQMKAYYDDMISLMPEGLQRDIVIAQKEIYLNHPQEALKILLKRLSHAQGKDLADIHAALSSTYELLNNRDGHIYYLALAALNNIRNGITRYEALPRLVYALYEEDQIDRAYPYLMCTMEDANTYPSRTLALDVSKYFPVINATYSLHRSKEDSREKMRNNSLVVTFVLLLLALGVAFYLGWHQNQAVEEKKRADELQKALDQAAIADRVKTVFIQNMRHEIRTPLNAIMGFAQLMSNDLSDEERSLYNGYIMESNNQLLSTLDDIIDVSNMEVGTFNFHFTNIDVNQLCNERFEEIREIIPPGVEYFYRPLNKNLTLHSDRKRIGQVLHNLLSNACKNTTSGKITLSATHYEANDIIQFVVTDTGTGIPPDKTDVIFEHFEKLDHYSPGLGLGLYVCRLIARALGGDIHLDTLYTEGARFVFTIPCQRNSTHEEEEETTENNLQSQVMQS